MVHYLILFRDTKNSRNKFYYNRKLCFHVTKSLKVPYCHTMYEERTENETKQTQNIPQQKSNDIVIVIKFKRCTVN